MCNYAPDMYYHAGGDEPGVMEDLHAELFEREHELVFKNATVLDDESTKPDRQQIDTKWVKPAEPKASHAGAGDFTQDIGQVHGEPVQEEEGRPSAYSPDASNLSADSSSSSVERYGHNIHGRGRYPVRERLGPERKAELQLYAVKKELHQIIEHKKGRLYVRLAFCIMLLENVDQQQQEYVAQVNKMNVGMFPFFLFGASR